MPRRYLPSSILSSFSVSSPQLLLRLHLLRGGKGGRTRSAQKTMLEMMMFSTSSSSSSGKKNNENDNDGRKATNIDDEGDDEFSNYEDLMAMEIRMDPEYPHRSTQPQKPTRNCYNRDKKYSKRGQNEGYNQATG